MLGCGGVGGGASMGRNEALRRTIFIVLLDSLSSV